MKKNWKDLADFGHRKLTLKSPNLKMSNIKSFNIQECAFYHSIKLRFDAEVAEMFLNCIDFVYDHHLIQASFYKEDQISTS